MQFCGYKGNYFNCDFCYGFHLNQTIMSNPHNQKSTAVQFGAFVTMYLLLYIKDQFFNLIVRVNSFNCSNHLAYLFVGLCLQVNQ